MKSLTHLWVASFSLFCAVAVAACEADGPSINKSPQWGSGLACSVTSDCPKGEVCAGNACRIPVSGGGGTVIGSSCKTDADCGTGETCNNQSCQKPGADAGVSTCTSDGDCAPDEDCVNGACQPHSGGNGTTCVTDADCAPEQKCQQGVCNQDDMGQVDAGNPGNPQCVTDTDCPIGQSCHSGLCYAP